MSTPSSRSFDQNLLNPTGQSPSVETVQDGDSIREIQPPSSTAQPKEPSRGSSDKILIKRCTSTRVIFFQVNDNANKLKKIIEMAHFHFGKNEPLLIFVEEEKGEKFVDELLWKTPAESFLPHTVSNEPTKELIVITKSKNNLNQARVAFNLCPTSLFLNEPLKIIYEFEDLTAPVKKNFSSQRFDAYKKAGFSIEAR